MAINSRRVAFKILLDIDVDDKYSNLALNKYLDNDELSNLDKRFIRQLVYGVLENRKYIDFVIKTFSKTPLRKINPNILNLLRLGVYQIKFLDKVPDSAAVNETVKIAKKINFKLSGFVNGILRSYIRNPEKVNLPSKKKKPIEYLSIKYSFEEWLVKKWIDLYGIEFAEELLKASNSVPKLHVRTNELKINRDKLIDILVEDGCSCDKGNSVSDIIITSNTKSIEKMDAYKKGYFTVQDASSMLVAQVLEPKANEVVMDLCSAPGGKTTHIAELMENKGKIVAQDIYSHKLTLIEDACERLSIDIVELKESDATKLDESLVGCADKVLVDAPCSGLGIIRRKPEIKYTKKHDDVIELSKIQASILRNGAKYLKPGGTLVYSTCTIMPEENQDIIRDFLAENENFELKNISNIIPIKTVGNTEFGTQLYPNVDDTDGFFIAKLIKKSV